jgi:DNA-binding transcriptional ArsR family regulator
MKTSPPPELAIEASEIKNAVLLLRAIDHPLRQKILQFIFSNQKVFVTEVHNQFNIEQSVASDHLGILRDARLVVANREGRFIFYSVNTQELHRLQGMLNLLG